MDFILCALNTPPNKARPETWTQELFNTVDFSPCITIMETGSLIDIGCDTVNMWMVFNSHHNSSFYCFWWRRPVVVCSRRKYKTRRSSAKLPEDYCFSLLAKCACIFSPSQAQVFVPLFMFYKRKKLINLFPEEMQACACSHLNFAEGEFLPAAVLSAWKRMGMDLPGPDVCWSWAGWLASGPFGDPRG